jgi:hypothetical protein
MMVDSLRTLPSSPGSDRSRHLETVVSHARGLVFFFRVGTEDSRDQKDAIPADFLKDGETWDASKWDKDAKAWTSAKDFDLTKLDNLKHVLEKSSKEIAHLTYDRVPSAKAKSEWNLLEIVSEMLDVIRHFVDKCDKKYLSDRLQTALSKAEILVNCARKETEKTGSYSGGSYVEGGTSMFWVSEAVVAHS